MLTTTEAQIEEAFSVHAPVERVKKIKDYAFVHFGTKQNAHMAMQAMNGN
jgi:RNA recognition motif-containing protein